jgi:hypothetical protein
MYHFWRGESTLVSATVLAATSAAIFAGAVSRIVAGTIKFAAIAAAVSTCVFVIPIAVIYPIAVFVPTLAFAVGAWAGSVAIASAIHFSLIEIAVDARANRNILATLERGMQNSWYNVGNIIEELHKVGMRLHAWFSCG